MSGWEELKAERNQRSLIRLTRALPPVFPRVVLARALARPFVPPTPRLAIESYWGVHPIRADRLARALAARSQAPAGWTWRLGDRRSGLPFTFRTPPAPFREHARRTGAWILLRVFGWHIDLWGSGPNENAVWHSACVVAWQFWNAPSSQIQLLRRIQSRRCAQSGGRLWRNSEVDHRVPLFRVWSEHRDTPWPRLVDFWGFPNLQVINRDVHAAKCATEARDRLASGSTNRLMKTGST
jgi:hypothetical protein